MARNQTSNTSGHDQAFQNNCSSFGAQSLIEKCEDRNAGDVAEETVEVLHAEEHGDGVEPGGYEADGYGSHDGDWDHFLWPMNFFSEMGGAVEAGKSVICVD